MDTTTIVTFNFQGKVKILRASGFANIEEAEQWGHRKACEVSASNRRPIYLANVVVDDKNFVCLATSEEYWRGKGIGERWS